MPEPRPGFTGLGVVRRAHGIRGEVRVDAFHPEAPHLQPGRAVWIQETEYEVTRTRPERDSWLIGLTGVTTREEADALRGALIETRDELIERDAPDAYFLHELVGLRVVTVEGEELGELVEVLQPGANDVFVVRGERGEVLVPAIREVVEEVDVEGGVVRVVAIPGLLGDSKGPHGPIEPGYRSEV